MSGSRGLVALMARFDAQALTPPHCLPQADAVWHGTPAWGELQHFCRPQRSPRLAVATVRGSGALACAEAFACALDGSARLQAMGRAAGLAWRLQIKLRDAWPWGSLRNGDPWDAGWARTAPASLRHLPDGFTPRRATLVLATVAERSAMTLPLATWMQRAERLPHPVRWLWVDDAAPGALTVHAN